MKRKLLVFVCGLLVLLVALLACGESASNSGSGTLAAPVAPKKLVVTHHFNGNGASKTAIFTVGSEWEIVWSCDPASFFGEQYNVQAYLDDSSGNTQDIAINSICGKNNKTGQIEEHTGGTFYLDVNSPALWTIDIKEAK